MTADIATTFPWRGAATWLARADALAAGVAVASV